MSFVKSYGRLPPKAISEEICELTIYQKELMLRDQASQQSLKKDRLVTRLSQSWCQYKRKFWKLR